MPDVFFSAHNLFITAWKGPDSSMQCDCRFPEEHLISMLPIHIPEKIRNYCDRNGGMLIFCKKTRRRRPSSDGFRHLGMPVFSGAFKRNGLLGRSMDSSADWKHVIMTGNPCQVRHRTNAVLVHSARISVSHLLIDWNSLILTRCLPGNICRI